MHPLQLQQAYDIAHLRACITVWLGLLPAGSNLSDAEIIVNKHLEEWGVLLFDEKLRRLVRLQENVSSGCYELVDNVIRVVDSEFFTDEALKRVAHKLSNLTPKKTPSFRSRVHRAVKAMG